MLVYFSGVYLRSFFVSHLPSEHPSFRRITCCAFSGPLFSVVFVKVYIGDGFNSLNFNDFWTGTPQAQDPRKRIDSL